MRSLQWSKLVHGEVCSLTTIHVVMALVNIFAHIFLVKLEIRYLSVESIIKKCADNQDNSGNYVESEDENESFECIDVWDEGNFISDDEKSNTDNAGKKNEDKGSDKDGDRGGDDKKDEGKDFGNEDDDDNDDDEDDDDEEDNDEEDDEEDDGEAEDYEMPQEDDEDDGEVDYQAMIYQLISNDTDFFDKVFIENSTTALSYDLEKVHLYLEVCCHLTRKIPMDDFIAATVKKKECA